MRILLLSHIKRHVHLFTISTVKELLEQNYTVDTELTVGQIYDCIIIFNRKHLVTIKNNDSLKNVPLIYMFCMSDIVTESITDPSLVDHIFVFNDSLVSNSLPLFSQSTLLPMISIPPSGQKSDEQSVNRGGVIYIDIDSKVPISQPLQKILHFLNSLDSYRIICYSENNAYKSLVNQHVKIVTNRDRINEYIGLSDIVIGSGYSIMRGIQLGKKTIIVGDKGYGGLVSIENLQNQYLNYFQGRDGGQIGEFIPMNLLSMDMKSQANVDEIKEKLFELIEAQERKVLKEIERIINASKQLSQYRSTLKFKMNTDFIISKDKGNKLHLINWCLYKLHKRFNESECVVLLDFREPTIIENVLNKYPIEYRSEISKFIEDLIRMKLILPFEVVS